MVFSLVSKNFKLSIDSNNRRKKLDDGDYKYLGYLDSTRWGRFRVVIVSLKIGADSMTSMNKLKINIRKDSELASDACLWLSNGRKGKKSGNSRLICTYDFDWRADIEFLPKSIWIIKFSILFSRKKGLFDLENDLNGPKWQFDRSGLA